MHPHPQPRGQCVDHRRAHAVQAAGDLVAAAAEFTAGVEHRVNHFQGRPSGLRLDIHGNAAAIIGDGDGITGVDGDGNMLTVPGQRLINGVVHDLIHQMVQSGGRGRADVHTGAFPHRFQTLQNLNLLRAIFLCHFCFVRHKFTPV